MPIIDGTSRGEERNNNAEKVYIHKRRHVVNSFKERETIESLCEYWKNVLVSCPCELRSQGHDTHTFFSLYNIEHNPYVFF